MFNNLIVLEIANNHCGDLEKGKKLIEEYSKFINMFPEFKFAIKFQYRNLNTFIHSEYKENFDYKYIKRFTETKLDKNEFLKLKLRAKELGFITVCTPFDEKSVDTIIEHDFDIIKIASVSMTDWPLLEKIVQTNKPIIFSTASSSIEDIDNIVTFLEHREKNFCIMHCIAEYPVKDINCNLNQIDILRKRYPNKTIGYSAHENPSEYGNIKIAIAKGCKVFEKHVDIIYDKYKINGYSTLPEEIENWLNSAKKTFEVCGIENERYKISENEIKAIHGLRRGAWLKNNVKKGDIIKKKDIFFAIPLQENQLTANDFSKYSKFVADKNLNINEPILKNDIIIENNREKILSIVKSFSNIIDKSNIVLPDIVDMQLSHHYGVDNFYKYGAAIFDIVNREYCKKLIMLLPNQKHPSHRHCLKEETFQIMHGSMYLYTQIKEYEKGSKYLTKGDIFIVERDVYHEFFSLSGCIFEEISTPHHKNDSYYQDQKIMNNNDRKTNITIRRSFFDKN